MGVLFYLRSDGQYILVGDAIMAVLFLLITMLCDVLIHNGRYFLLKVEKNVHCLISTSQSIMVKKHGHDSVTI
jgi:hypothetical protein